MPEFSRFFIEFCSLYSAKLSPSAKSKFLLITFSSVIVFPVTVILFTNLLGVFLKEILIFILLSVSLLGKISKSTNSIFF